MFGFEFRPSPRHMCAKKACRPDAQARIYSLTDQSAYCGFGALTVTGHKYCSLWPWKRGTPLRSEPLFAPLLPAIFGKFQLSTIYFPPSGLWYLPAKSFLENRSVQCSSGVKFEKGFRASAVTSSCASARLVIDSTTRVRAGCYNVGMQL